MRGIKLIKKGLTFIFVFMLIFSPMLIGCGSNQAHSRQSAASDEANKAPSSVPQQANSTDLKVGSATIENHRKIIQHATLTQKVTGFDTAMQKIQQLTAQSGGFVQSSSLRENEDTLREASYILRVPEGKYSSILGEIQKVGKTAFITQKGDDVTQEYYDNEAHIKNLKLQEEAVQKLMEKAEKMEDILKVQEELFRIRGEIESLQGKNRYLDNLSSLATIELTIQEVKPVEYAEGSSWQSATEGFIDSLKGVFQFVTHLLILLITALPYILFLVLPIGFIVWKIIKRREKEKKAG